MALTAPIVWEIRKTATAGNVNGGGFDPDYDFDGYVSGTDYSQQDSAQIAETVGIAKGFALMHDLASSEHVGNIVNIISGTNMVAGRYLIVGYVLYSNFILDRVCTTNSGADYGSDAVWNLGGALSLESSDDAIFEAFVDGNTVWIKGG